MSARGPELHRLVEAKSRRYLFPASADFSNLISRMQRSCAAVYPRYRELTYPSSPKNGRYDITAHVATRATSEKANSSIRYGIANPALP
jgi:hypothetical protein